MHRTWMIFNSDELNFLNQTALVICKITWIVGMKVKFTLYHTIIISNYTWFLQPKKQVDVVWGCFGNNADPLIWSSQWARGEKSWEITVSKSVPLGFPATHALAPVEPFQIPFWRLVLWRFLQCILWIPARPPNTPQDFHGFSTRIKLLSHEVMKYPLVIETYPLVNIQKTM